MLYAALSKHSKLDLPMAWDKPRAMFDYLTKISWSYQLEFQSKLFNGIEGPDIIAVLIRWEDRKRNLLLQTSDPKQLEAALTMLISEVQHDSSNEK